MCVISKHLTVQQTVRPAVQPSVYLRLRLCLCLCIWLCMPYLADDKFYMCLRWRQAVTREWGFTHTHTHTYAGSNPWLSVSSLALWLAEIFKAFALTRRPSNCSHNTKWPMLPSGQCCHLTPLRMYNNGQQVSLKAPQGRIICQSFPFLSNLVRTLSQLKCESVFEVAPGLTPGLPPLDSFCI